MLAPSDMMPSGTSSPPAKMPNRAAVITPQSHAARRVGRANLPVQIHHKIGKHSPAHIFCETSANFSSIEDQHTQTTRVALHDGDTLIALLFASPNPVRLARSHAVSLIGTDTPALTALAGRVGAGQPDAGPDPVRLYECRDQHGTWRDPRGR